MAKISMDRKPGPDPFPSLLFPLIFLVPFLVYLFSMGPCFINDDSPETVTAGMTLGIPHPPGYALSTLFGRLFGLLPLASPAFRAGLGSAFWGALGVLLLGLLLKRSIKGFSSNSISKGDQVVCLIGASLCLAFSTTWWQKALSPKGTIYLLQSCLLLAYLWVWNRQKNESIPQPRYTLLAGFLFALGFTNHWETQVIFLPFFLFAVIPGDRHRSQLKFIFLSASLRILALTPFLYLPLRARLHPSLDLGAPDSLSRFMAFVLRKYYAASQELGPLKALSRTLQGDIPWGTFLSVQTQALVRSGGHLFQHLWQDTSWPIFLLALLGITLTRRLLWLLPCFGLLFLALLSLPTDPSSLWYLDNQMLPVNWGLCLFAGWGVLALGQRLVRNKRAVLFSLFLALPFLILTGRFSSINQRHQTLSYDYGVDLLRSAPKTSILFAESDEDFFTVHYLQQVLDERRDVKMIPSFLLFEDWGLEQISRRYPELRLSAPSGPAQDPIGRMVAASSQIFERNQDRSPIAFSYFEGALHRYYLPSQPSALYRKNGLLGLWDAPPVLGLAPWDPGSLRLRNLWGVPSNRHPSLVGILKIYELLGLLPQHQPLQPVKNGT